jgi:hypothetical protein
LRISTDFTQGLILRTGKGEEFQAAESTQAKEWMCDT